MHRTATQRPPPGFCLTAFAHRLKVRSSHCLFDIGHDLSQRVQVGLVNVLGTKGLRLITHEGLALTHSLAHGLRVALQKRSPA